MLNQETNSTENLKDFIRNLFFIYREIEFELIRTERNQTAVQNLVHLLDITFDKIHDRDLFNQDTMWLKNTLSNAKKERQMSEGSADAMNQLTDQLMDEMEDERSKWKKRLN